MQAEPLTVLRALLQTQPGMQVQRKGKAEFPLIIYVLLESEDVENEANFRYYVREAVREDEGCTHVILVDQRRVSVHDILHVARQPSSSPEIFLQIQKRWKIT